MQIVGISVSGISVLRGMPKAVKALASFDGKADDPDTAKAVQRAEQEAALASREVERGFPVLHGLAVVALWSWLEHFVKDLLMLWLLHREEALHTPALQKLRVRLGDYLSLERDEQAYFLIDLLEQDLSSSLKRGVNRFESLLAPFELSFALTDECRRTLFELQQVRNAIAHRSGLVDRRLQSECPWLALNLNESINVSHTMLDAYSGAAGEFLLGLLHRVGDRYNVDLRIGKPDDT